jgi:hypothetical protein
MSRALCLVAFLCACSSPASRTEPATPATPAASQPEPAATAAADDVPVAQPAAAPPPSTTSASTASTASPSAPDTGAGAPITRPSQVGSAGGKPLYSCFSYVAVNTTTKRHTCMRTADCPSYVEQARSIKGLRELTGCESMASVWCFHQLAKDEPEGVDVCQPTLDDCNAARAAAVKAKESVDTPCAQR